MSGIAATQQYKPEMHPCSLLTLCAPRRLIFSANQCLVRTMLTRRRSPLLQNVANFTGGHVLTEINKLQVIFGKIGNRRLLYRTSNGFYAFISILL
jgi:hypothetical protein